MEMTEKLALFQELIGCGSTLYTWCYDGEGQLLSSNCPDEALLATVFANFGCKEKMLTLGRAGGPPAVLGTAMGLIWGVDFLRENGKLLRAYAIGPAFFYDVSMKDVERGFTYYERLEISLAWKHQFLNALPGIPVAQNIVFSRYLLMLHYCLTGEKLDASSLNFQPGATEAPGGAPAHRDRHKVWMAEQAMLQMVRTGDLNYKSALNASMLISNGVPVQGRDPLRQAKTSITVFTSIVCRAAIEGGLSPEEAYSLGDSYIQSAERATEYSDLASVSTLMYDDFVRRVHKCRTNPKLSPQVQKCVDHIEMHLGQKIRARDLAALVGYTEYYLTHKFKEETGLSVSDYMKFAKVERAKILLCSTELSVQEISDRLCFGTRNYFSRVFNEVAGCTPMQYREGTCRP